MTGLQPTGLAFGRVKITAFAWLASLAILVNHTPLGRVKTCVIILLGASALTSV